MVPEGEDGNLDPAVDVAGEADLPFRQAAPGNFLAFLLMLSLIFLHVIPNSVPLSLIAWICSQPL